MNRLRPYLVLVAGIHDTQASPASGFTCWADSAEQALGTARDHFGLPEIPAGSIAMQISAPVDVRRAA